MVCMHAASQRQSELNRKCRKKIDRKFTREVILFPNFMILFVFCFLLPLLLWPTSCRDAECLTAESDPLLQQWVDLLLSAFTLAPAHVKKRKERKQANMEWQWRDGASGSRFLTRKWSNSNVCLLLQILMNARRASLNVTTIPAVSTCPAGTTVNAEVVSMTMDPTNLTGAPAPVSVKYFMIQPRKIRSDHSRKSFSNSYF